MSICEGCKKQFKSSRGLNIHLPFCERIEKRKFICEYCDKELSTSHILFNHQKVCREKDIKTILSYKEELNEKNKLIEKLSIDIQHLQTDKLLSQTKISDLERENRNLLKQLEENNKTTQSQSSAINILAKKSGNVYNNNSVTNSINNILQPITKDDYERLCEVLIDDHDILNAKQFAHFCLKNGFKNKILKTDHARKVITYVNESGDKIKDPKAKELSETIFKSTKSVFQEKAKQYEKFQDEQDQDRLDFYNDIVAVNKNAIAEFGVEIANEANKSIDENIPPLFKRLKEKIINSLCYVYLQGTFGIGEWIFSQIEDEIIVCRTNTSIKKKFITIKGETRGEKVENKELKEALYYVLNVENFEEKIISQLPDFTENKKELKESLAICKKIFKSLIIDKDKNEWDNVVIGLCGC